MKIMVSLWCFYILFSSLVNAQSAESEGCFPNWENVPKLIDSIAEDSYEESLNKLSELTLLKLGNPRSSSSLSDSDHKLHVLKTRNNWRKWWDSTGVWIEKEREANKLIDKKAFHEAWAFLGIKNGVPKDIPPVWIPEEYRLTFTFNNSDYLEREVEIWVIQRSESQASLVKLRASYDSDEAGVKSREWGVKMLEIKNFTPRTADQTLRAICYSNYYSPKNLEDESNYMRGIYYGGATMRLIAKKGGSEHLIWNSRGIQFTKSRSLKNINDGFTGRSFYFFKSKYSDHKNWAVIDRPTSDQLSVFREFLSNSRPVHDRFITTDVIELLVDNGGVLEQKALLKWAEKQKLATHKDMDWSLCCDDFLSFSKQHVISVSRVSIEETLDQIRQLNNRIEKNEGKVDRVDERSLAEFIKKIRVTEEKERIEKLLPYPQPLRSLLIADTTDNLNTVIQRIRSNPDPKLFLQIIVHMRDGNVSIPPLLNLILHDEKSDPKLKPWEDKNLKIAVDACIDYLPGAEDVVKIGLIENLLILCGGGHIEFATEFGGESIEVKFTKDGHTSEFKKSENPMNIPDVQRELRLLYQQSKLKKK